MGMRNTKLFVISGPSGAGLGQIVESVMKGRSDLVSVIPVTSRKMKEGEVDGSGFFFYDLDTWNALKAEGDLLETTEFAGNDYGTSRRLVQAELSAGRSVLLNLDPERASQIKASMPEAVCIYMEPSSEEVLRSRYEEKARSVFEVSARLELAARQRSCSGFCDCRISTDSPETAAKELNDLIDRLTA